MEKQCEDCLWDAARKGCPVLPCGRYVKSYTPSNNGVFKAIETWYLIVPLHDNNGNRYPDKLVETVRNHVLGVFGGDTETDTIGSWKQGQRVCLDESVRIEIDVLVEDHDKAEAYMAEAKQSLKRFLRQDKIYVTMSRGRFELLLQEEFVSDIGLITPLPNQLDQMKIDMCRALAAPIN